MKALLAIPCYRCEAQIPRVLAALAQWKDLGSIHTLLLIDNRSPDGTVAAIQKQLHSLPLSIPVKVVQNHENFGLGGSQKLAMEYAKQQQFDALIVLHGDDQGEVSDISPLLSTMMADSSLAAVLGSRFMSGSRLQGYRWSRIFGNRVLNILFTICTGHSTMDLGSGLNVFRLAHLEKVDFSDLDNRFVFNVDLLLQLYRLQKSVKFLPIHWKETDQISNARNFQVAWAMLKSLWHWIRKAPSRHYPSPSGFQQIETSRPSAI